MSKVAVYYCPEDNIIFGNMPKDGLCPDCGWQVKIKEYVEIQQPEPHAHISKLEAGK